jgi:hypothetical protein
MLPLVFDEEQKFGGYFGDPARCRLRIYAVPGQRAVCIATELPDNPGTSITDRAEGLATIAFCIAILQFRASEDGIVWIEHHPGRPDDPIEAFRQDLYSRVKFDWDAEQARFCNPRWEHVTRETVEDLIGQPLGGPPAVVPLAN